MKLKWENKIKQKALTKYLYLKYKYDFQQYEAIKSFGESIYFSKISIHEADMDQVDLLENMIKFTKKSRPKTKEDKDKKQNTFDSVNVFHKSRKLTANAFRKRIFPVKEKQRKGRPSDLPTQLKILTPKQTLQRLPIALAQVKVGNTSQNLLNEIRQIIYSLVR